MVDTLTRASANHLTIREPTEIRKPHGLGFLVFLSGLTFQIVERQRKNLLLQHRFWFISFSLSFQFQEHPKTLFHFNPLSSPPPQVPSHCAGSQRTLLILVQCEDFQSSWRCQRRAGGHLQDKLAADDSSDSVNVTVTSG